jgi:hypothetical protein
VRRASTDDADDGRACDHVRTWQRFESERDEVTSVDERERASRLVEVEAHDPQSSVDTHTIRWWLDVRCRSTFGHVERVVERVACHRGAVLGE